MEGKNPMMAGTFTEANNKRKCRKKKEMKARRGDARSRSRPKSKKTEQASPQKKTN